MRKDGPPPAWSRMRKRNTGILALHARMTSSIGCGSIPPKQSLCGAPGTRNVRTSPPVREERVRMGHPNGGVMNEKPEALMCLSRALKRAATPLPRLTIETWEQAQKNGILKLRARMTSANSSDSIPPKQSLGGAPGTRVRTASADVAASGVSGSFDFGSRFHAILRSG